MRHSELIIIGDRVAISNVELTELKQDSKERKTGRQLMKGSRRLPLQIPCTVNNVLQDLVYTTRVCEGFLIPFDGVGSSAEMTL